MIHAMRRLALLAAAVLGIVPTALAQAVPAAGPSVGSPRPSDYYAAPGLYGTSYGYASYGVPRTHTEFSAHPWSGYYANYRPYSYMPGRFGAGLWRPGGSPAADSIYGRPTGRNSYRTFPVTSGTGLTPDQIAPPPPIGVYAPAFGPGVGPHGD
jgi:hypothetical protein